jgi:glycosyltransferase involved in cell wall biosynthesis
MNIPQAVETHPSNFSLKKKLNLSPDDVLFLLPAGLRDIKDPLYLMDEISDWHRKDSRIFLVVIGATRDQEYADRLHATAKREHGIIVLDPLPQPDLWAAMQEATAVLNTSKSECSPNSILEAMYVGAPLLVRDIPGNTSIVQHRETGLVFDSPKKFRTGAMELISNILRRNSLIQNAKMAVLQYHNKKQEKEAYLSLLSHLKV